MKTQEPSQRVSETGDMFAWNTRYFPAFWLVIIGVSNGREDGKDMVFWVVDKILPMNLPQTSGTTTLALPIPYRYKSSVCYQGSYLELDRSTQLPPAL